VYNPWIASEHQWLEDLGWPIFRGYVGFGVARNPLFFFRLPSCKLMYPIQKAVGKMSFLSHWCFMYGYECSYVSSPEGKYIYKRYIFDHHDSLPGGTATLAMRKLGFPTQQLPLQGSKQSGEVFVASAQDVSLKYAFNNLHCVVNKHSKGTPGTLEDVFLIFWASTSCFFIAMFVYRKDMLIC